MRGVEGKGAGFCLMTFVCFEMTLSACSKNVSVGLWGLGPGDLTCLLRRLGGPSGHEHPEYLRKLLLDGGHLGVQGLDVLL